MNNKKVLFSVLVVVVFFGLILSVLSSSKKENDRDSLKIKVVTTLFPFYDFAKAIGGDKVEVKLLLPPGVEAHSFEPKPSDVVKINESDLFVYTGKYMEPWAEDVLKGVSNKNLKVVDSSSGISMIEGGHHYADEEDEHEEENDHEQTGFDPHIWLDFDNDKIIVDNILASLLEVDPLNKEYYENNAKNYKNKLSDLDNKYSSLLSSCQSREIVYGGHYAFSYMGKKYNFVYESAYGISPDSEPSASLLVKIIEQIKNHNIKYIFSEEMLSPKLAETISNETGAGMLVLDTAENISKEDYNSGETFISIMERNLLNLSKGLDCKK